MPVPSVGPGGLEIATPVRGGSRQRYCAVDAAELRLRLIVDVKMGAIANCHGIVTLRLAATGRHLTYARGTMFRGEQAQ